MRSRLRNKLSAVCTLSHRSNFNVLATLFKISQCLFRSDFISRKLDRIFCSTFLTSTEIDDTAVTASVKSALVADADIKSFDFKVETRKGVVMLSGFVENQAQIDRAVQISKAVEGVASVSNEIKIKK